MKTVGIICEYNPFHNGHLHQLQRIRETFGADCAIVCLMSGHFVQRGAPAIVDKSIRAHMALLAGADLVLELPVTVALNSAEGFAAGGVQILSQFCDVLSFGTETMTEETLFQTAEALLSPRFSVALRETLASGCSFPAARQRALERLGLSSSLSNPNDILAVEYTKAIIAQNSNLELFPVLREGSYHAADLDSKAPSATAVRRALLNGEDWIHAVPDSAVPLLKTAALHTLGAGDRAILYRLRTMSDRDFEALPFGSEGLWRKLMKASRSMDTLGGIIDATKSKRYTRTRIDRMILCGFLGLTEAEMGAVPQKVRVLGFRDRGRALLRGNTCFQNAGENVEEQELRLGSLYGLFRICGPEDPDIEKKRRIIYIQENR